MSRRQFLHVVSWRCSAMLNQLTPSHIVAGSLITLWLILLTMIDLPLLRATREMTMQLASVPQIAQEQSSKRNTESHNVTTDFVATLPEYETYSDQLRELNVLADKNAVTITRIDYQYVKLTGLPIRQLALRMAIRGPDLQQRRFLQSMLNTFTNLSISRLAYARSQNDSTKVEQKLDVHLYYHYKGV